MSIAARFSALVLGLLAAELILFLAGVEYPAWDRPTVGLREWGIPNAEGWAPGETRIWAKLNAEGARDVDHSIAKPDDALRVVVVGDSFAVAFEVELEQAFWSVLARELNECPALGARRVEVINISKRGYGTTEELLALRRFGFAYDPDWVVLAFLTGNDFRNNSKALRDAHRPYYVHRKGRLVLDESYADSAKFRRWTGWQGDLWYALLQRSRLVQATRHLLRQIKVAREVAKREQMTDGTELGLDDQIYLAPSDTAWQSAWKVTEDVIRLMRTEVEEQGAGFLLMTLSNPIQVNPDRTKRAAYAARVGAKDLLYPDRRLEAFAMEDGIHALVLAPGLREWAEKNETCVHGFRESWPCQGHWNVEGHRLVGRRLAHKLCQELAK